MYKLTIYVTQLATGKDADRRVQFATTYAIDTLNEHYGGCTVVDGCGCYVNAWDAVITEPVKLVHALTNDAPVYHVRAVAQKIAEHIKSALDQEVVLWTIEDVKEVHQT
jgi:hypothetical protein